ncbi:hypothetical protein K8Z61_08210 [Nocardioides sp. TRM66260-LWL]|uniref:hypothetical protein n=1 Tax=Nocardioides sp. TRM66260-LWL TaxID=2874478 RepID=UPI001CC4F99C|nr:hypothetical protein [Nocardioides sp. TRM66260-LWL]MBZ5734479.1 hypothetical protein [Nocardioides sp. TRM66260-LWL]
MTHEPTGSTGPTEPTEATGSFDGDRLTGALDVLAERIAVGPPPLDAVRRGAARRRRVRTGTVAVAGLAAASVLGAVVLTATGRPAPAPVATDPAASGSPSPAASDAPAPPPGTRWVGSGHVAIAVPEDFPVNALPCPGVAVDTAIVDPPTVARACEAESVDPTTQVDVFTRDRHPLGDVVDPGTARRIADLAPGVEAERFDAVASVDDRGRTRCEATTRTGGVDFTVVSDEADACARVDALLDTVTYLPGLVGVPGPGAVLDRRPEEAEAAAYRRVLGEAGLSADRMVVCYCSSPAYTTDPAPGSMVPEGSDVTLVARGIWVE